MSSELLVKEWVCPIYKDTFYLLFKTSSLYQIEKELFLQFLLYGFGRIHTHLKKKLQLKIINTKYLYILNQATLLIGYATL